MIEAKFAAELCTSVQIKPSRDIDDDGSRGGGPEKVYSFKNGAELAVGGLRTVFKSADGVENRRQNQKCCKVETGSIRWPLDTQYEGEMVEGIRYGAGKFQDPRTGLVYEGGWKWGLKEGFGKLEYPDGSVFEGFFHRGLRHGQGILQYASGNCFMGQFENDRKKGFGKMYWPDLNMKYRGFWENDRQNGFGECVWWRTQEHREAGRLETRHLGSWKDGHQHGYGVSIFANGDVLMGTWAEGKKDGWFLTLDSNGQEKIQRFHADKIIGGSPKNGPGKAGEQCPVSSFHMHLARQTVASITESAPTRQVTISAGANHLCSQTLEEMNVYRHIVNEKELFGSLQPSGEERKQVFEVSILLLIRFNAALRSIYDSYSARPPATEATTEAPGSRQHWGMTIGDFLDLIDSFDEKSPYLTRETFLSDYFSNWKNLDVADYRLEDVFWKLWLVRLGMNRGLATEEDRLFWRFFSQETDSKAARAPGTSSDSRDTPPHQVSPRKTKLQILGTLGSQMRVLEGYRKADTPLRTRMRFFNFVNAILKSALISANYCPQLFERALQTLLSQHLAKVAGRLTNQDSQRSQHNPEEPKTVDLLGFTKTLPEQFASSDFLNMLQTLDPKAKTLQASAALRNLTILSVFFEGLQSIPRPVYSLAAPGVLAKDLFASVFRLFPPNNPVIAKACLSFLSFPKDLPKRTDQGSSSVLDESSHPSQSIDLALAEQQEEERACALIAAYRNHFLQELNSYISLPKFMGFLTLLPNLDAVAASLAETHSTPIRPPRKSPRRLWKRYSQPPKVEI